MGYLLSAIPLALTVALIVHVFRTGRDRFWIYILAFVPLAGAIAYVIIEILPELLHGRGAHAVRAGVARVLDPDRTLRERQALLEMSPTVENRKLLAEAWEERGEHGRAAALYRECLEGIYADDRALMSRLARALHHAGDHAAARDLFDRIASRHGALTGGELLQYAMTLEALGDQAAAGESYKAAAAKSPGLEVSYRYASFLKRTGRDEEAEDLAGRCSRGSSFCLPTRKRTRRSGPTRPVPAGRRRRRQSEVNRVFQQVFDGEAGARQRQGPRGPAQASPRRPEPS